MGVVLAAVLGVCAQEPATQNKEAAQGLPPRVAPTEYYAQAKAGVVTIAAEFVRHSVPTAQGTLSTEDFVVVEAGLYGPPDARIQISLDDFSLRINGKKTPLRSQPYGLVLASLKDPEWVPPEPPASSKSKTSIGGGGGGQADSNSPPPVVHVPIEVQRAMAQHTQKASLPLGDRVLPQAGLLFFEYRGNLQKISSIELIYSGPAGKATLPLRP
ncbi:MAG: hypothetical protein LAP40_04805 [Acidobacteriia bacterium]|nr:hypothetical protein [Terriglobia bacterium]